MSDATLSAAQDNEQWGAGLVAFVQHDANTLRDNLTRLRRQDVQVHSGGIQAASRWCELNLPPQVLLVDLDDEALPLPEMETLLAICGPTTRVIALGQAQDITLYRALLQLGVTDYLVKPCTLDLISATLAKCEGGLTGPEYARMGRTVAVLGASGGVGTSTVAMGLARLMSRERHLPTALVDFDRRQGDQLLLLGMNDDAGLNAVLSSAQLDARLLHRAMLQVDNRLHLLAQKPDLQPQSAVESETVLNLGGALCRMFNQVCWDLPAYFPEGALDVARHADLRILVTGLTLQDARNVKRIMEAIGDESEGQRLLLVHNQSRFSGPSPLSRSQFETLAGHRIDLELPHAGHSLTQSLSMGPLELAASAPFQQNMRQLVDLACGSRPQPEKKPWLRGLLKRA